MGWGREGPRGGERYRRGGGERSLGERLRLDEGDEGCGRGEGTRMADWIIGVLIIGDGGRVC